jgi:hypothetical protein
MGWPSYYEDLVDRLSESAHALSREIEPIRASTVGAEHLELALKAVQQIEVLVNDVLSLATDPTFNSAAHEKALERALHTADVKYRGAISAHKTFLDRLARLLKCKSVEAAIELEIQAVLERIALERKASRDLRARIDSLEGEIKTLHGSLAEMHKNRSLMLDEYQYLGVKRNG